MDDCDTGDNQYSYAGNDPANAVDPTGLAHIVVNIDSDSRLGTGKIYADPGDIIIPGASPTVKEPTVAHGGELVYGPFDVGNKVPNPTGDPTIDGGNGPFPPGTWPVGPVHMPPSDPEAEGPAFINVGGPKDPPGYRHTGIHGGRGSYTHGTLGCLRVNDNDLLHIIGVLDGGKNNRVTVNDQ